MGPTRRTLPRAVGNSLLRSRPEHRLLREPLDAAGTAASGAGRSRRRSAVMLRTCAGLGPALAVSRLSLASRRSQGSLSQPVFRPIRAADEFPTCA